VNALAVAPIRTKRGLCGPTEQNPFPSLGWLWLDWTYAHLPSPTEVANVLAFEAATTMARVESFVTVSQPW
jgi:hypothetical protein